MVCGGMIVGFDADGPDIFARQLEFASVAALPIVTLGALVAPAATPLHRRLQAEGRLLEDGSGSEVAAMPWSTNIVPKLLGRDELFAGVRRLAHALYAPAAFGDRMLRFLGMHGPRLDRERSLLQGFGPQRSVEHDLQALIGRLAAMGPAESTMVMRVSAAMQAKPETTPFVAACLRIYAQIRHMYARAEFCEALSA